MARVQAFDRDEVVRAARTVFWQCGYDGTPIPALEAATGIRRSSLYNTFGSKRGLFDAAVQSYLDEVIRPRLQPMLIDAPATDAVVEYLSALRSLFENPDSMPATCGCLLINTAGSPIAHDAEVSRVIAGYRSELETAIYRGIRVQLPELAESEVRCRCRAITGLIIGAFAIARIDAAAAARSIATAQALLKPITLR